MARKYNSYYLYQKYCNIGGQGMIPVYPNVYSNDADGTQSKRLHVSGDTCCNDVPAKYRTTSGSPYCDSSYNKCVDVYSQISYDNGETWETTATTPTIIEYESEYCRAFRWINMDISTDYWCDECTLDYSKEYLTLVPIESGVSFSFTNPYAEFSLDEGESWIPNHYDSIPVELGKKILWKGTTIMVMGVGNFSSSGSFITYGNTMSLLYGDDFEDKTELLVKDGYSIEYLFQGCTGLTSAENMVLPATTLEERCYERMFYGCTSLTTAPSVLPATTLARACYLEMFSNCTSLTTLPELPATTLVISCYERMFYNCSGLTTVPSNYLSATTLAADCYYSMFYGCTSLTTAPALPATTLESYCYSSMFRGCTSLTTAPELPATTVEWYSYQYMFYGCTSLNYIKCLATDISEFSCTHNWVNGVSSSGTFVKPVSMNDWETGVDGIPSGWTIQNI